MLSTEQNPLFTIESEYGQSIWMDNLSRDLLESGELAKLITTRGVLGITSNPAIFEKAIVGNAIYDTEIKAGIQANKSLNEIYESLIFSDIRRACDILLPVYKQTNGIDGYVSIEVPPTIATDTKSTIAEARRYHAEIARPNVMIKIPGTPEGLPAVEQMISEGISINVTLLFAVESYVEAAWAYIRGLETRVAKGEDISNISSVASFFLSRIDISIDAKLDLLIKNLTDPAKIEKISALKGKIAIANAKIAYQEYKKIIATDRWQQLEAKGARVQRLLWASTSTKDPSYSDVMYVDGLVGDNTVNTLPPNTLEACADHCDPANRIEAGVDQAYGLVASLQDADINIDLDAVMDELLIDGLDKFVKPFDSLMKSLASKAGNLTSI
ncbi:MAG: transaldolase [Chamaesiphon sp.]|nr:transaldolase [Chamaesiphon sp.]